MKSLRLALLMSVLAFPALAADNFTIPDARGGVTTLRSSESGGVHTQTVNATVSASITGFEPGASYASLTASGSSASVALPTGESVVAFNVGTTAVSCTLSVGAGTAVANRNIIQPNSWMGFAVGTNTHFQCIDQTGSASNLVVLSGGSGLPSGAGGGASGGGGAGDASAANQTTQIAAEEAIRDRLPSALGAGGGVKIDGSGTALPVSGTFFQATQPVSAAALPLPTGAATAAKQPALGTAGSASTDVITVQGIASGTPQPISAASLPLPTGAATAAKQPALGTAGSASTDVITVQGIASGTPQPVSAASLPLPSGAATSAKQDDLLTAVNAAIPAGTNIIGKVGIDQTTPGTTNAVQAVAGATGGATPHMVIAANSNNSTSLKGSAGTVYSLQLYNDSANIAYVKLYNKATAPTCGTDTPVVSIGIPGNTSLGGNNVTLAGNLGVAFGTGIGYCIVTGKANNDNTSVAASVYTVNINYK